MTPEVALEQGAPVPASLGESTVLDREGRPVALRSFWADGPALLVFMRRFACLCAGANMLDLAPRFAELHALGVRTVLIGSGRPEHIGGFARRCGVHDPRVEILTDPSLEVFRAAGLLRSWWATYGPRALWDQLRLIGAGHLNRWGEGDAIQQGGSLLVDTEGRVAWYQRSTHKGGHAPAVEVVEAVIRLALQRAPLSV